MAVAAEAEAEPGVAAAARSWRRGAERAAEAREPAAVAQALALELERAAARERAAVQAVAAESAGGGTGHHHQSDLTTCAPGMVWDTQAS